MALKLKNKKAIVASINEKANEAVSLVVADARGLPVSKMTELRQRSRQEDILVQVIKNSLAKRAFKDTHFECLDEVLSGPSMFAFSMEDPGAGARLFKEFAKSNEDFEIKVASINGQLLEADQIDMLAKLPTLDQARASLCSVMLATVTKLVRTVNEIPAKVVRVVDQVAQQKST